MLGLPTTFWWLCFGMLVNRLGGAVFMFLSLYLTAERGFSAEDAGTVVALFGAGMMGAGPVGGWLADHLGRRTTILIATLVGAALMVALGLARSPLAIALAAFFLGFAGDLYRPAMSAVITDIIPEEDRARAFGYEYWAINLGFAGAGVLAGWLAEGGYWRLFAADAATTLFFGLLVYARLPETRPRGELGSREPSSPVSQSHVGRTSALAEQAAEMIAPFRDQRLVAFSAIQFLVALIVFQGFVALPLDLKAHGISSQGYGTLMALNGILVVLFQPTMIRLATRWPRRPVLAAGSLLTGVGFSMTGIASAELGYAASIAVWTLGELLISPVAPAVVAELAPPHQRGRYQGVFQLSWGVASSAGPVLGALVLGRFGAGWLWAGCGALGVVAAILQFTASATRPRAHVALPAAAPAPAGARSEEGL